ncbi:CheR family methyltransferase [Limnoglobus roseus]|uniref:protein-glutamate O-methyltransferase n=1 Tax=Limnoglobus roseus TaxID=2598579 RepID=A0A5C1AEH2_9BACT|nr:protein-glutamate O-methyltransferase CheR [Limnoglobus roseus]QEL16617.1 chemotaxis protein CheR [Limnoglobus roseus]
MTPDPAADPDFPRIKDYVIRATGLAYYADKDADLAARLGARMGVRGVTDCGAYLRVLADEPDGEAELDALITDLTIGETFFFRHREAFAALRDVVFPDLIARNRDRRRLRIWSAGCSVGAEPYSISILLRRDLAAAVAGWDVTVVGTDINRAFLARACRGLYEGWVLRGVPDDLRAACFTPAGSAWQLVPEYRAGVSFQYHNLVANPFPSLLHDLADFDLILCRNVTIYFGPEIIRRLIGQFHQSLTDGGWLVVGHSEPNLELFREFRTVNAGGAVLYQKLAGSGATREPSVMWPVPTPTVQPPPSAPAAWAPWEGLTDLAMLTPRVPPPEPIANAPTGLDAVRRLADRGAWAEAARGCEELLARNSLNPAAHFYHGMVLEHLGRPADAERALRRVIYLDRSHALAHYHLSLFLQRHGRLGEAARSFGNALKVVAALGPNVTHADGDGISTAELTKLIRMHLAVLEGP